MPQPTHDPTPIDAQTARRVAHLSRLALSDDQIEAYRAQLADVLRHIGRLQELDLSDVAPLAHPLDTTNRIDDDTPRPGLSNQTLIDMAPDAEPPFIKVPKVLGGGAGA